MSNNPGLSIQCDVDLSAFERAFGEFADQIPYATSLALNAVAVDAQKAIRGHIHDEFIVRRRAWIDNSVKIKPFATKETLSATVSIDPAGGNDVLSKFEDGGTKASQTGGNIAIPNADVFPDNSKVIPQAKRPRNLKGAFKVIGKSGAAFIFTAVGRGRAKIYKLAYSLQPSVRIPKKLGLADTAMKTVNDMWQQRWNEAWEKATSTAFK